MWLVHRRASTRAAHLVASLRQMLHSHGRRGRLGKRSTIRPTAQQRLAHGGGLSAERRLVTTRNDHPRIPSSSGASRFPAILNSNHLQQSQSPPKSFNYLSTKSTT